jgi:hypothetical protein
VGQHWNKTLREQPTNNVFNVRWESGVGRFDKKKSRAIQSDYIFRIDQIRQGRVDSIRHPCEYSNRPGIHSRRVTLQSSVQSIDQLSNYPAGLVLKLHISIVRCSHNHVCAVPRGRSGHCKAFFNRDRTIAQSRKYVGVNINPWHLTVCFPWWFLIEQSRN